MLNEYEKKMLFQLIEKMTGNYQSGPINREILVSQVEAMQSRLKCQTFKDLLLRINSDQSIFNEFVSEITNHTTNWFREDEHFEYFESKVIKLYERGCRTIEIWSCAAATGEEVYSIALVLENLKKKFPELKYKITGTDIDGVSLKKARRGIYKSEDLPSIPQKYKQHLLIGNGKRQGYFSIKESIRANCEFKIFNLLDLDLKSQLEKYHFIFCRNVLMYFHATRAKRIVEKLARHLISGGKIYLSLTEPFNEKISRLTSLGHSRYELKNEISDSKPKALIIDDDPLIRSPIRSAFEGVSFEVLEVDALATADRLISKNDFNFIIMELQLSDQDCITWLRNLRTQGYDTPVVIISGSSDKEAQLVNLALESGALEFIEKERLGGELDRLVGLAVALTNAKSESETVAALVPAETWKSEGRRPQLIAIGASTGGPRAIWDLLKNFANPTPPIVIVQHLSPYFAKQFAETLGKVSGLELGSCQHGSTLENNRIYVGQGDYHIGVELSAMGLSLKCEMADEISGHRPSVDYLFSSVAQSGAHAIGIILTGMGQDGANGMLQMQKTNNCYNMAQDADSSVVFGMPKSAIEARSINFVGNIQAIRNKLEFLILSSFEKKAG